MSEAPDDDAAARYYSPPPPRGFREKLRANRNLVVALSIVGLVFGGIVLAVVLAGGKGSGNLDAAFEGSISTEDQIRLNDAVSARTSAQDAYVDMVAALAGEDFRQLAKEARQGESAIRTSLGELNAIENDDLRDTLEDATAPFQEMFDAYADLGLYLRDHRGRSRRATLLIQRAARAETAAGRAQARFYERISDYLTPEQREQAEAERRAWEQRVKEAAADR